jgi:hypothetical protein
MSLGRSHNTVDQKLAILSGGGGWGAYRRGGSICQYSAQIFAALTRPPSSSFPFLLSQIYHMYFVNIWTVHTVSVWSFVHQHCFQPVVAVFRCTGINCFCMAVQHSTVNLRIKSQDRVQRPSHTVLPS